MARIKLADTTCASPNTKPGKYWDILTPGLRLLVGAKTRSFQLQFEKGGKKTFRTLGHYPALSLVGARDMAKDMMKRADAGVPIVVEPVVVDHGYTLDRMIDEYEAWKRKNGKHTKSLTRSLQNVRTCLADFLQHPAAKFSEDDLRKVRDDIYKKGSGRNRGKKGAPKNSNRFMMQFKPITKWARSEKKIPVNIALEIIKVGGSENARERVLTHDEIARVWWASFEMKSRYGSAENYGRMLRFKLCVLQRLDECVSLTHGSLIGGYWKQEENKSDRPHKVKLPQIALDQIGQGEPNDLVFPGKAGRKMSGFSKLKPVIDQLSGVSNWVHHDLRRTGSTEMQELGVELTVIDAVQNHAIPGVGGKHYLHALLEQPKADALELWGRELEKIVMKRRPRVAA